MVYVDVPEVGRLAFYPIDMDTSSGKPAGKNYEKIAKVVGSFEVDGETYWDVILEDGRQASITFNIWFTVFYIHSFYQSND